MVGMFYHVYICLFDKNFIFIAYSCHGSWRDNTTSYVIGSPVSRHSTDARYYCFIFNQAGNGIVLQRVAETCAISARPVEWAFNITDIGNFESLHNLHFVKESEITETIILTLT
jgi:hypothetical protein